MTIRIKRVYETPSPDDGVRYLVDQLWPRGKKREDLQIEAWLREVAPSKPLLKWFGHDPEKWEEFRSRYYQELNQNEGALQPLVETARNGTVTLVYAARDEAHNNALALKQYLDERFQSG